MPLSDTLTIGGRNRMVVESKISQLSGFVDNYGIPKFTRRFTLLRHCLSLTPRAVELTAEQLNKMRSRRRATAQQMEDAFSMGAEMLIYIGCTAPLPGNVLDSFGYYETFFSDVGEKENISAH